MTPGPAMRPEPSFGRLARHAAAVTLISSALLGWGFTGHASAAGDASAANSARRLGPDPFSQVGGLTIEMSGGVPNGVEFSIFRSFTVMVGSQAGQIGTGAPEAAEDAKPNGFEAQAAADPDEFVAPGAEELSFMVDGPSPLKDPSGSPGVFSPTDPGYTRASRTGVPGAISEGPTGRAAQSITVQGEEIIVVDSFNRRILVFDASSGALKATVAPAMAAETDPFFTWAVKRGGGYFFAFDRKNGKLIGTGAGGAITGAADRRLFIDDITEGFIDFEECLYAGDTGRGAGRILVFSPELDLIATLRLPGLIPQGFAIDEEGRVHTTCWSGPAGDSVATDAPDASGSSSAPAKAGHAIDIFGVTGEAGRVEFFHSGRVEPKIPAGVTGPLHIAGMDEEGRYYLYRKDTKADPDGSPTGFFFVVDSVGEPVGEFTVPISDSPCPAAVLPEGGVVTMAYGPVHAAQGHGPGQAAEVAFYRAVPKGRDSR